VVLQDRCSTRVATERAMEFLNEGEKQMLETYLEGKPYTLRNGQVTVAWFGKSAFAAKEKVKAAASGSANGRSQVAFDGINKWWGTLSLENVPKLIDTNLWVPVGLTQNLIHLLHTEATKRTAGDAAHAVDEEATEAEPEQQQPPDAQPFPVNPDRALNFVLSRQCPMCPSTPAEQFLDCSCCDEDAAAWEICKECMCIHNPRKLKRLKTGAFDDKLGPGEELVVACGFSCLCKR
jgi:hypothetical protein